MNDRITGGPRGWHVPVDEVRHAQRRQAAQTRRRVAPKVVASAAPRRVPFAPVGTEADVKVVEHRAAMMQQQPRVDGGGRNKNVPSSNVVPGR